MTVRALWQVPLFAFALRAQAPNFASTVYPVLEKAACRGCHGAEGVASATRLHFPEPDASPAAIDTFGKSLVALVDQQNPAKSLLLNKPTNRIPHTGGKRIAPGSKDEKLLASWIDYLAKMPADQAVAAIKAGEPQVATGQAVPVVRRLTHSQYNHTVHDLLGDETSPADQFPPEDFVNGYKNQYQSQSIGPLLADAYSAAAEKLAKTAFRGGDEHGLIPCKPASPADMACQAKFIRAFGLRAFRRPLLDAEVARYAALFASQVKSTNSFATGAQVVVEAMLQSPNFLFITENGTNPKWRGYEDASRLAYFFWDSMPDDALLRSAAAGELDTAAGFEKGARRMLNDPRARRSVDEFLAQWLRFDRVLNQVKDRRSFPMYTPELALAMTEETRRLLTDLIWNNGDFRKMFSADYSFLNSDLASIYGLPAPAGEFDRMSFPPASDRAGIIGQATFLALTSKPAETSPTARGLFVREQFLCQKVPDPPPGVAANLPPITEDKPMTNRERLGVHLSNESCATCHNLLDPIGFGLEKFDAVGRRQERVKVTVVPVGYDERKRQPKTVELPLNTAGKVAGIPNSEFSSPKELGRVLAESPQCQECVVKQLFRYAAGRSDTAGDRPLIRRCLEVFANSQFQFKELMIAVAKFSEFPPEKEDAHPKTSE